MARSKSQEIYNARRRAKRLANRIEKSLDGLSPSARAASESYLRELNSQIAATYVDKRGTKSQRQQSMNAAQAQAERLEKMTGQVRSQERAGGRTQKAQRTARANKLFEQQLNAANLGQPSMFGANAGNQVDIFYAATKSIWQGKDPTKRNEYIMKALGTDSLAEAYQKVIRENRLALNVARRRAGRTSDIEGTTSDNTDFYDDVDLDPEQMGSAAWLGFVHFFE